MNIEVKQHESYLGISMKLLNLEQQKLRYESVENSANASYIYAVETEIKAAITKLDSAPHRSQELIDADIEKYTAMRSNIMTNLALMNPDLSPSAENHKLNILTNMIRVLKDELNRK